MAGAPAKGRISLVYYGRLPCAVRYWRLGIPIVLRVCYALSGTGMGHAGRTTKLPQYCNSTLPIPLSCYASAIRCPLPQRCAAREHAELLAAMMQGVSPEALASNTETTELATQVVAPLPAYAHATQCPVLA
eukprot:3077284-Rhodomonas_salina.3